MSKIHNPRAGTLSVTRVRAKRIYPNVNLARYNKQTIDNIGAFLAYKVRMAQVKYIDTKKNSSTFGTDIVASVTILEAPKMLVSGARSYKQTLYGLKCIDQINVGENLTKVQQKNIKRKTTSTLQNKNKQKTSDGLKQGSTYTIMLAAQPTFKKTPEVMEVPVSKEKIKEFLAKKEISVADVLKEGSVVDICGVTKGFGFDGTVKRFGVKYMPVNSRKKVKGIGSIGSQRPARVNWRVPWPGQTGYQRRTEFNKYLYKIISGKDLQNILKEKLNKLSSASDYILLRGSVMGPEKRAIVLQMPVRAPKTAMPLPKIEEIIA
ncbi:MAG: 50S ribosomal protein L3 [Euryarchaeota archaeon HGW-Euryarchaeota-1]|nr:MAG: 50S ribosomal protein L3 [Euryarchaeota archaeon HGW-Euryarchaeota-1]